MDHHVAVRRVGKIQLQGLPVIAVVERDVHAAFRTRGQQPRLLRVAADHPGEAAARLIRGQTVHDRRP